MIYSSLTTTEKLKVISAIKKERLRNTYRKTHQKQIPNSIKDPFLLPLTVILKKLAILKKLIANFKEVPLKKLDHDPLGEFRKQNNVFDNNCCRLIETSHANCAICVIEALKSCFECNKFFF